MEEIPTVLNMESVTKTESVGAIEEDQDVKP